MFTCRVVSVSFGVTGAARTRKPSEQLSGAFRPVAKLRLSELSVEKPSCQGSVSERIFG